MRRPTTLLEDLAAALRILLGALAGALVVSANVVGIRGDIPDALLATGWLAALGNRARHLLRLTQKIVVHVPSVRRARTSAGHLQTAARESRRFTPRSALQLS